MTDLVPLPGESRSLRTTGAAIPVDTAAEPAAGLADEAAILDDAPRHRSTIGCVIAVSSEEESIAQVIEGLLGQTRVPDVIHVVVNNTSAATVRIASQYAGAHEVTTDLGEQFTEVFVHDIGKNPDNDVDALDYGYTLVEGYDYLLGVDGNAVADVRAVEYLESEADSDTRIGGRAVLQTPSMFFTLIRRQHGYKV